MARKIRLLPIPTGRHFDVVGYHYCRYDQLCTDSFCFYFACCFFNYDWCNNVYQCFGTSQRNWHLRAIGASKKDISHVFNAETIIEGLIAGLLGVGITALLCIPVSALIELLFDVPNIALLPINAAVILVLISVFLTFIAGLIPSSSASRKDPVEALRSE